MYDELQNDSKNTYSIKRVPLNELAIDQKFNKAYKKVSQKSLSNEISVFSRTQIENEYGFTIVDEPSNVMDYNNKTSYSLQIEMDSTQADELKNLVIEVNSLNESKHFIVSYKLDENAAYRLSESEPIVIKEIAFDPSLAVSSRYRADCFDVTTIYCKAAGTPQYCGGADTQFGCYSHTITLCTGGSNNGAGFVGNGVLTSPVDSNHQTGGGSGSNNSQPPQTPCETLNDAMQNAKVNQGIQNLKAKTLLKKESAYQIKRTYSYTTEIYNYTTTLIEGDNYSTNVPTGGTVKGQAHNHPINGQSIPSIGDVYWSMQCQTDVTPASSVGYNIAVCPNPASPNDPSTAIIYAITVENLTTLTNSINATFNRPDLVGLTLDQKYKKLNDEFALKYEAVQNSASGMEQKFLDLYANFGISLYKFDNSSNNWNKLNLTNNTVTPQPCE